MIHLVLLLALGPLEPVAPMPQCSDLVPQDARCKAPDGAWQECPVTLLRARLCEVKKLRLHVDDLKEDLEAMTQERDQLHAGWTQSTESLRSQRDAAYGEADRRRRTSLLGYVLGAGGAAGLGAGIYLGTHHDIPTGAIIGTLGLGALCLGLGLVL